MKIELLPVDEFIDLNELKEISSPIIFQRGGVPVSDGLLSNDIFGMNVKSRKQTFAYLKLSLHFFHPHVYKALTRVYPAIDKIIAGQKYMRIENGKLVEDMMEGDTGLKFIYNNWNRIKWERTDSEAAMRKERLDLLTSTPKNKIFLDKFIVIPVFYRDINSSGGGAETDPLNTLYTRLIRLAANLRNGDMYDFSYHGTIYNIQKVLVELYDTFKHKLERKNGMIRKYLMGKNVGFCTRSVITNPVFHANKPSNIEIPFDTCGVPLGQACVLAYPFVMRWLKAFFEREFIDVQEIKTARGINPDGTVTEAIPMKIYKPELYFDEKYIKKLIDSYVQDPESRFDPLMVPVLLPGQEKPTMMPIVFTGKILDNSDKEIPATTRAMTSTDILFLAADDALKNKHTLITRYPVSDAYGMFITKCRPISTARTERVEVNGEVYEYYPYVKLDTSRKRLHLRFVDSLRFSNSFLAGIGGDLT